MKNLLQDGQQFRAATSWQKVVHDPDYDRVRHAHVAETLGSGTWTVLRTSPTMGNAYDPAPPFRLCHNVTAVSDVGELRFTQESGYSDEIRPEHVEWIAGPPDEPGFYRVPIERKARKFP